MPKNNLQKALQSYLSKIKRDTRSIQLSSKSLSSRKWVLSGCKHPKMLSLSTKRKHRKCSNTSSEESEDEIDKDNGDAATLSDVDRFLQENFKSLYVKDDDADDEREREQKMKKKKKKKKKLDEDDSDDEEDENEEGRTNRSWHPIMFDSPKPSDPALDHCKLEGFFFAPGSSGLLSEDARPSVATTTTEDVASSLNSSAGLHRTDEGCSEAEATLPENCIAVPKYTAEPYDDFRQSMLEMVEARLALTNTKVDWDFMEELLFCYLDLNAKTSHRFILSAFVDLIVILRQKEHRITRKDLVRSLSIGFSREGMRRRRTRQL